MIRDISSECLVAYGYVQALQCTLDHLDALGVDPGRTEQLRNQLHHVTAQLEQIAALAVSSEQPLGA